MMREVARPARDDVLEESCSPAKGLEDGASSCGDGSATGSRPGPSGIRLATICHHLRRDTSSGNITYHLSSWKWRKITEFEGINIKDHSSSRQSGRISAGATQISPRLDCPCHSWLQNVLVLYQVR